MDDGLGNERRYPKRARKLVKKDYFLDEVASPRRWSAKEQHCLLANLEKYGDQDIVLLASKIGTKGPFAVYTYLQKHKEAAQINEDDEKKPSRLVKWIEYMREKKKKTFSPSPAAVSMLMISLLEDHPVSTDGEVNFPEAYKYMFQLFAGRHTTRLAENMSEPTRNFIKLTVVSLMQEVAKDAEALVNRFLESARGLGSTDLSSLPVHVQHILTSDLFNPLGLNEAILSPEFTTDENEKS